MPKAKIENYRFDHFLSGDEEDLDEVVDHADDPV